MRKPEDFRFESLPRVWFAESPAKTHALNAIHVILVHGERYMIRTLNECARKLADPEISEQVRWFSAQEAAHASAHRNFVLAIEKQGFRLGVLNRVCRFAGEIFLPKALPRKLNLATTAAIEHTTAVVGYLALRENLFREMNPAARQLFEWHCAEEIEHKAVVHDVLTAVAGRSWLIRVAGMGMAALVLSCLTAFGTIWLLAQDRQLSWRNVPRDFCQLLFTREALLVRGLANGWVYFHPSFHPDWLEG